MLPEIEIVAFDVRETELVFAEAVQGFIGVGLPLLLNVECVLVLDAGGFEVAGLFREQNFALEIGEGDVAREEIHSGFYFCGGEDQFIIGGLHIGAE